MSFIREVYGELAYALLKSTPVHTGEWHAKDTSGSPIHATYELMNVTIKLEVPDTAEELEQEVRPNMPWAETHFRERVSGIPYNPPPSHLQWPWAHANARHQDSEQKFSHTYPERFWPRWNARIPAHDSKTLGRSGIRYRYGDLNDVVNLLVRSPLTRQAYLPVWFPEDTGNVSNVRVPCTLGYHFMIRNNMLHCWYPMRSCDFVRHLPDDVYLAGRLMQWVVREVNERWETIQHSLAPSSIETGKLHMTISSLHAFLGDEARLNALAEEAMVRAEDEQG